MLERFTGTLIYGCTTGDGRMLEFNRSQVLLLENGAADLASMQNYADTDAIYYAVLLDENGSAVAQAKYIVSDYLSLGLKSQPLHITRKDNQLIFESDIPVLGVCLDLNTNIGLSDNMFDVFPKVPYQINIAQNLDIEKISVKYTLNDFISAHHLGI